MFKNVPLQVHVGLRSGSLILNAYKVPAEGSMMNNAPSRVVSRSALLPAVVAAGMCLAMVTMMSSCGGSARDAAPTVGAPAPEPPEPPRSGGPGADQTIDEAIRELPRASLAFNAPKTMRVHKTAVIQALMSDTQLVTQLQSKLTEVGQREGARIVASDEMEASLQGLDFKIQALTPARQPVGHRATRWAWEIEPTGTGRRRLHLTLTALIDVDSGITGAPPSRYAVRTFERTLNVESVPVPSGKKVTDFLSGNWQWLISTLLLPAGLALWQIRRGRKAAEPTSRSQEKATGRTGRSRGKTTARKGRSRKAARKS